MKHPAAVIVAGVAVLAVALAVIAASTTATGGHDHASVSISTSIRNQPTVRPDSPVVLSPRSSTAPKPSRATAHTCTGSLTQAQLQTRAVAQGATVHTHVAPFGCVSVYKVKPGDTLFAIARTFAVHGAYLTLYQWNQSAVGQNPDLIRPGQVIIVDPTGVVVTAP